MARSKAWADTLVSQALVIGTQVNLDLLVDLTASDTITGIRFLGRLVLISDNALGAVDGAVQCDIGIQVVTDQAFSSGGAAVPQVSASAQVPARGWIYRDRLVFVNGVGAGPIDWHYEGETRFDVGTMRKVDRGTLLLSMRSGLAHGTGFNVKLVGIVRVLCMT